MRSVLGNDRAAELRAQAQASRIAREARRRERDAWRRAAGLGHVTLRLDRIGDEVRLEELAALSGRGLPNGPFVVAEVEGRMVVALPVDGGEPLTDPFEWTLHLVRLLEMRARQIRRAEMSPRRRFRLMPRRA
jgi:hypothetical protein